MGLSEGIWVGIGIIIFLMLLTFLWGTDFWGIQSTIKASIEKAEANRIQQEIKANTIKCPTEIIPNKVPVIERYGLYVGYLPLIQLSEWKDKTLISTDWNYHTYEDGRATCLKGSKIGENINYNYCSPLNYKPIKENLMDNKGNIIVNTKKITTYVVNLVLNEISEEKWTSYDEFESKIEWGNYSVVSATCIKGII